MCRLKDLSTDFHKGHRNIVLIDSETEVTDEERITAKSTVKGTKKSM